MIFEYDNYRSYLRSVLVERIQKNRSYSLRAMAKNFDLSAAALSQVLNAKKNISLDTAHRIALRLELSEKESDYFKLLIQLENVKSEEVRDDLLKKLSLLNPQRTVTDLTVDAFKVIADWYHFAILALTDTDMAFNDAAEIAKCLHITELEAKTAIERLLRLEMLEKTKAGFKKTHFNPRVQSINPDRALRKFHGQTLTKAIESLEGQTPQEKFIGSETIAINSKDLKKIAEISEDYLNRVLQVAHTSKKKDAVYHLGVQFFKFTKLWRNK